MSQLNKQGGWQQKKGDLSSIKARRVQQLLTNYFGRAWRVGADRGERAPVVRRHDQADHGRREEHE
eukprot:6446708-Prorocentrum_lima.AAC.1